MTDKSIQEAIKQAQTEAKHWATLSDLANQPLNVDPERYDVNSRKGHVFMSKENKGYWVRQEEYTALKKSYLRFVADTNDYLSSTTENANSLLNKKCEKILKLNKK